jgi:oxygen-independent coproporphyrinogen-3 oxidase
LYIHIPFCVRKCGYCDFNSYAGMDSLKAAYSAALVRELAYWRPAWRDHGLRTVFFGGGTPSELPLDLLEGVVAAFHDDLLPGAEVTLEANPGTIDEAYLRGLRELGVNRMSIGVQSFDDGELRFLERIHDSTEAVAGYQAARRAGFDNVNLDLIYGLPDQTVAHWQRSLERAIDLAPEHLSLYALTVEPDTALEHNVRRGLVRPLEPDLVADMYELNLELTAAAGYQQYEISNFARPGRECRHNLTYWRTQPYLGAGCGAHGFLGDTRYANVASPKVYVEAVEGGATSPPAPPLGGEGRGTEKEAWPAWVSTREEQTERRLASDWLIMGLRLNEGVYLPEFHARFGVALFDAFTVLPDLYEGLLEVDCERLRLTQRGRLLHSEIAIELLEPALQASAVSSNSPIVH